MKKWLWVLPVILLVGAGGGYYYYNQVYLPARAVTATPVLQTAAAARGDLTLSASGVGSLQPSAALDLGFSTSGRLIELNVDVGDEVQAGAVLARVDDTTLQIQLRQAQLNLAAAERNLEELTSAAALAAAEQTVAAAQQTLAAAQQTLHALTSPDVAYYQEQYDRALQTFTAAQHAAEITSYQTSLRSAKDTLDNAANNLKKYQDLEAQWPGYSQQHGNALENAQKAYDRALQDYQAAVYNAEQAQNTSTNSVADAQDALAAAKANLTAATAAPDALELAQAQAQAAVAEADLAQAQAHLTELQNGALTAGIPSILADAQAQVEQAKLSLKTAELNVANAVLTAPFAGTITAVNGLVGQTAGNNLLSLAALDHPLVRFYVDETDLGSVAPDYPVAVTFEAAPDVTFTGQVTRVDPALVTVGNSAVVQAWAALDPNETVVKLLAGMNAEVDVIAGQAKNALLVPVQALRELAPGSYAVFKVQADGQLRLTPVTVGLKDFASAEILSGLNPGDVVSTGTAETGE